VTFLKGGEKEAKIGESGKCNKGEMSIIAGTALKRIDIDG
jgi:hypothetical protein